MKKSALAILAMSIFAASSAMAAGAGNEISINGSMDSSKADYAGAQQETMTNVNIAYGMYFTPQVVGRVAGSIFAFESGGSKSTATVMGVGGKYYFAEGAKSAWVPFALADFNAVAMESGGNTMSGFGFDVGVGVSNFITESVSFDIDAKATSNTLKPSAGNDVTNNGAKIDFGFTARF